MIKYFVKPSQQWRKKDSEMLNDSLVCITIAVEETRLHIISISAGKLLFNDTVLIVKKRAIKRGRRGT